MTRKRPHSNSPPPCVPRGVPANLEVSPLRAALSQTKRHRHSRSSSALSPPCCGPSKTIEDEQKCRTPRGPEGPEGPPPGGERLRETATDCDRLRRSANPPTQQTQPNPPTRRSQAGSHTQTPSSSYRPLCPLPTTVPGGAWQKNASRSANPIKTQKAPKYNTGVRGRWCEVKNPGELIIVHLPDARSLPLLLLLLLLLLFSLLL